MERVARYKVPSTLIVGNRQVVKAEVLELAQGDPAAIVMDFVATGIMDSAALGMLVELEMLLSDRGIYLLLDRVNEDVHTLFSLTHIESRLFVRTAAPVDELTERMGH